MFIIGGGHSGMGTRGTILTVGGQVGSDELVPGKVNVPVHRWPVGFIRAELSAFTSLKSWCDIRLENNRRRSLV